MASHTTATPAKVQASVNLYLNSIASASTQNIGFGGGALERITRSSEALSSLQEQIEKAALGSPERARLESERDALFKNLQSINNELARLETSPGVANNRVYDALSPVSSVSAVEAQKAAVVRENLRKVAAAADAQAASQVRQQEFEEQDLSDPAAIQVIRSAYQHYLLYNTDFFCRIS